MDLNRTQWIKIVDALSDIAYAVALQNNTTQSAETANEAAVKLQQVKKEIENGK
jgi:argininosuccinate lyase